MTFLTNPYVILLLFFLQGSLLTGAYMKGRYDCTLKHKSASQEAKIAEKDTQIKHEIALDQAKTKIRKEVLYVTNGNCDSPRVRAALDGVQRDLDTFKKGLPVMAAGGGENE